MSPVAEIIGSEVRKHGVIPFIRFMEMALYCPLYGYYEKKRDNPGRRGDFMTSVSVGKVFGELLAFEFARWLDALPASDSGVRIVEAGAHDGRLAKDILAWLREHRTKLFDRLEYWIVEPSAQCKGWQEESLQEFGGSVRWAAGFGGDGDLRASGVRGIIFSNELLDAFPVHRIGWDATSRIWFEWGVTMDGDRFAWTKLNQGRAWEEPQLPEALLRLLPDGFTTEVCPAAERWWLEAAGALRQGKIVTIDYGLEAEEFFLPERAAGTLRAYRDHQFSTDLLASPGEQDLTAHVNFTALRRAGEGSGLRTEAFIDQGTFLTRIMEVLSKSGGDFGQWNSSCMRQFQTLTHPQHLGRPFKVLAQNR